MATFTNQATLAYNDIVTNSNIVEGEIRSALRATKTAITPSYATDDIITYAVSIINAGTAPLTGLTVSDDLGAYPFGQFALVPLTYVEDTVKYYVNGVLQATPDVTEDPPLKFSGISVPACGNAMILYSVRANAYAPLGTGGSVVNTVTIFGGNLSTPIVTSETIDADTGVSLSITKAIDPSSVAENQPLTVTLTVYNTGGAPAVETDDAVITDTFSPPIAITSVTYNGAAWTSPQNYTYNPATGEFATIRGQVTVPAATYTQDTDTGAWNTTPGIGTLVITGTVS